MTREEAIEHLKEWREVISSGYRKAVIDMAIEALNDIAERKDEPQTNADQHVQHVESVDLINIQMAIEHWGRSGGNLTNDQIAELQREIESLPSADRPTGKWVEVEEYDCVCYQCDQCKSEYVLIDGTPQDNDYNYCPHCGARLGGDTE